MKTFTLVPLSGTVIALEERRGCKPMLQDIDNEPHGSALEGVITGVGLSLLLVLLVWAFAHLACGRTEQPPNGGTSIRNPYSFDGMA